MWDTIYNFTEFLWGTPLLILMVGIGLYLTIRSGFFQILGIGTWMKRTLGEVFSKKSRDGNGNGQLKPFQALSAVLAGTVGSGNIAGVASAIAIGGPGAVFWMWIITIVGMMIKMVEVTLSVAFRKKNDSGEYYGGPMYYMKNGLGKIGAVLAAVYAVALFIMVLADACFVQPNTLAVCVNDVFSVPLLITGIIVVAISFIVIMSGGIKKIGDFCGKMVPPMIMVYIVGCRVLTKQMRYFIHSYQATALFDNRKYNILLFVFIYRIAVLGQRVRQLCSKTAVCHLVITYINLYIENFETGQVCLQGVEFPLWIVTDQCERLHPIRAHVKPFAKVTPVPANRCNGALETGLGTMIKRNSFI